MAYFSNGCEGDAYEAEYCNRCVNWRDKNDDRGPGCPVWDCHLLFAYDECNRKSNAKTMLDLLIPMMKNKPYAAECSMFLPKP